MLSEPNFHSLRSPNYLFGDFGKLPLKADKRYTMRRKVVG
jgi:hypothetical protein